MQESVCVWNDFVRSNVFILLLSCVGARISLCLIYLVRSNVFILLLSCVGARISLCLIISRAFQCFYSLAELCWCKNQFCV